MIIFFNNILIIISIKIIKLNILQIKRLLLFLTNLLSFLIKISICIGAII